MSKALLALRELSGAADRDWRCGGPGLGGAADRGLGGAADRGWAATRAVPRARDGGPAARARDLGPGARRRAPDATDKRTLNPGSPVSRAGTTVKLGAECCREDA